MSRLNLHSVMQLTAQAYAEKKSKYNHIVPVREYKYKSFKAAKSIDDFTPHAKYMNRSVRDVNTEFVPQPIEQPKSTKRTIFVTILKNKQIVQG